MALTKQVAKVSLIWKFQNELNLLEIFELKGRRLKRTQWKQRFAALFVLSCRHKAFLCQFVFLKNLPM